MLARILHVLWTLNFIRSLDLLKCIHPFTIAKNFITCRFEKIKYKYGHHKPDKSKCLLKMNVCKICTIWRYINPFTAKLTLWKFNARVGQSIMYISKTSEY